MPYRRFFTYNLIGGVIWVAFFVLGGYFFGNIPFVRENLPMVLVAVLFLAAIPVLVGLFRHKFSLAR
jgi:membrane-associated protein